MEGFSCSSVCFFFILLCVVILSQRFVWLSVSLSKSVCLCVSISLSIYLFVCLPVCVYTCLLHTFFIVFFLFLPHYSSYSPAPSSYPFSPLLISFSSHLETPFDSLIFLLTSLNSLFPHNSHICKEKNKTKTKEKSHLFPFIIQFSSSFHASMRLFLFKISSRGHKILSLGRARDPRAFTRCAGESLAFAASTHGCSAVALFSLARFFAALLVVSFRI